MKNKFKTSLKFLSMLFSVVFFLSIYAPFTHAEILSQSLLGENTHNNAVNHQGFKITSAFADIDKFYLGFYDKNITYDFCIADTVNSADSSAGCIAGQIYTGQTSDNEYQSLEELVVDFQPTKDTQYYFKIYNKGGTLRVMINNSTQTYTDGAYYYGGTEYTGKDMFFLIDGTLPQYCQPASGSGETSSFDFVDCEVPENSVIQRITGCENIYTTGTSSPDEIRSFYYDIPAMLFVYVLIIALGPVILIFIYFKIKRKK